VPAWNKSACRKNVSLDNCIRPYRCHRHGLSVFRASRCREFNNHDITMTTITTPTLSRRQKTAGANHHLWNNHGTWWFHGTVHLPDGTAERVRVNLKTDDLPVARRRRDSIQSGRCIQNRQTRIVISSVR
jgi:hypothetical protein